MKLSEQTILSVEESIKHIREAIAFASRCNDDPMIVSQLTQTLMMLNSIVKIQNQTQTSYGFPPEMRGLLEQMGFRFEMPQEDDEE